MWVAVVGGLVGAVFTALVGLAIRLWRVPGEVEAHDRLIAEQDEDLASWVVDEQVRLGRDLDRILNELAARGILWSSERNWQRALAKERTLHSYRDQERQARRFAAELRSREGPAHAWWRRRKECPFPEPSTPEKAVTVLDYWRERESYDGTASTPVNDPTARTLEKAIEDVAERRERENRLREQEIERRRTHRSPSPGSPESG